MSEPLIEHGGRWGTAGYWRQLGISSTSSSNASSTSATKAAPPADSVQLTSLWEAALTRQRTPSLTTLLRVGPRR